MNIMKQPNSRPSSQSYALHLSNGYPCSHTHFQFYTKFLKGKKPTQSIALEVVTLPEEFCTEVIYCLAQLKFKKKKKVSPLILVPFQGIPFKTTQAKIFTKVRHSQTTLRGWGKSQGRYMKDTEDCTITRSQRL